MIFPKPGSDTELFIEFHLHEIHHVASILVQFFGMVPVWLFEGELGAGKTTLVQALKGPLYIENEVSSPTFSLVNEYQSTTKKKVYHLDLYRLSSIEEGIEIGLFEIIDSGYFCLIEWASAIRFQPQTKHMVITLEHLNEKGRKLTATLHEN